MQSTIGDEKTTNKVTFKINNDGSVNISSNGAASANAYYNYYEWLDNYLPYNTSLSISGGTSQVRFTVSTRDVNDQNLVEVHDTGNGGTITIPPSNVKLYIALRVLSGTTINTTVYPMIRLSVNTNATYSPYTKSTDLTISLGQTTVYGCHYSVEDGALVVDKIARNINDAIFGTWRAHQTYNTVYVTDASSIDKAIGLKNIFGSCYSTSNATSVADIQNGEVRGHASNTSIYIRDDNYVNDATAFVNARGNEQLCYDLATPITINLTPHTIKLLEGVNNISTDGDKITLTYRDGSVATLGDLTSAVDNLDSKIDESKILTDTATGDKYILVVTNGVLDIQQISN